MKTPKISEYEQKQLRESAKSELLRLRQHFANEDTTKLIDKFKNKFNTCESVYKIILREHQKSKGKKVGEHLTITMTQVPHALSFAGYTFDPYLLTNLFGASSPQGTTVKKLRDATTHGMNKKAVKEILDRKDELFGYMDTFLNIIETFDSNVA